MPTICFFHDDCLGKIAVRVNARARRFVFRVKDGALVATVPQGVSESEFRGAVVQMRPKLRAMLERAPQRQLLQPGFRIDAECFAFWFEEANVRTVRFRERKGELVCLYPNGFCFEDEPVQVWLRKGIEESLRRHAQVLFPPRLRAMAKERNLVYDRLHIHKTKSRWGSCSTLGSINLSLYLMLLPMHLQDFVMHHELTHLQEMNHGPRFHRLLDEAVKGEAKRLEAELKSCKLNHIIP